MGGRGRGHGPAGPVTRGGLVVAHPGAAGDERAGAGRRRRVGHRRLPGQLSDPVPAGGPGRDGGAARREAGIGVRRRPRADRRRGDSSAATRHGPGGDVHQPRRRDRDGQRALHARGVGATPQARAHGAGAADPRPGPKRQRRNHRRRRTDGPPHPGGRRALARLPVNLCADSETGDATRRKRVVDFTLAASGGQPAQPVGVVHTRVGVIFSRVL